MNVTHDQAVLAGSDAVAVKAPGNAVGRAHSTPAFHWLRGYWPGFVVVVVVAAFLDFYRLGQAGFDNLYYAAAVRSMLESQHNFFFVSFDPGGFVTVDKPPLGFWFQTLSAWLFGFQSLTILLPQALAGVISVGLVYHLVRRDFGPVAGLLAGLVLAITPISVATNRNNTIDSVLVVFMLLAAWAVGRAAGEGRLRWLLLGAALVGLGFNVKMLEAYLIVPALAGLYLLAAPLSWRTRLIHLILAGGVLAVISLSWATAVDLTPPNLRPYVGSSTDNSELELIIGHNGLERLFGRRGLSQVFTGSSPTAGSGVTRRPASAAGRATAPTSIARVAPTGGFGRGFGTNAPSPLRLFDGQLASQISWLLPLALIGLAIGLSRLRTWSTWSSARGRGLLLWGIWLISQVVFFSVASEFQTYYLVVLAPAIAALVGIGTVSLWATYRAPGWRGWVLPITLVATAFVEAIVLRGFPTWASRLTPIVVGVSVVAAVVLTALRLGPSFRRLPVSRLAAGCGVVALLVTPALWAGLTLGDGAGRMPQAGPTAGGLGAFASRAQASQTTVDPKLLTYLEAHRGDSQFLLATTNANQVAPIILQTGAPVMAMGGFMGSDPILTPSSLSDLVRNGTVRYFLLPGGFSSGRSAGFSFGQQSDLTSWVSGHCSAVPTALWQSSGSSSAFGGGGSQQLWDCGGASGSAS